MTGLIDITKEFLSIIKVFPTKMLRTRYNITGFGTNVSSFYIINMTWKMNGTTITLNFKDTGAFDEPAVPLLVLESIAIKKKKWYNLYTKSKLIEHSQIHTTHKDKIYELVNVHYLKNADWTPSVSSSINNFL
jgi:hypothetical protein